MSNITKGNLKQKPEIIPSPILNYFLIFSDHLTDDIVRTS